MLDTVRNKNFPHNVYAMIIGGRRRGELKVTHASRMTFHYYDRILWPIFMVRIVTIVNMNSN